jgi:hypothetical protein
MLRIKKKALLITCLTVIVVAASFFMFPRSSDKVRLHDAGPAFPPSSLNKPLPKVQLVDLAGEELRVEEGKMVLVIVTEGCRLCLDEASFLATLLAARDDVRFYGVVPFGADRFVLKTAEAKFPFKLYFDEGGLLGDALRVNKVPVKLYIENGILKKGWGGATNGEQEKEEFKQWLISA